MAAYERPDPSLPLADRIAAVIHHYDGLPCPGCMDAAAMLEKYRQAAAYLATMGVDIEAVDFTKSEGG